MTVVSTEVLLDCVAQTGVLAAQRILAIKPPNRTHIPIAISITVGTATVVIEGRNSILDAWVTLLTISSTDNICLQYTPEMRCRLTAATGATVHVSLQHAATVVA